MKFFLDTANLSEIRDAVGWGLIDGITTNPSLVAKEKRPFEEVLQEICRLVHGPISAETVSTDADGMIEEGRYLSALHPNIVVKVPLTKPGLKAARQLGVERIKTNVTLCFSPTQALLAAKAGATYVSPFIGRLDDISQPGMELIRQIKTIFTNYRFDTQILVASVRNPVHVVEAAMIGADVATMPFAVLEQLVKHPLTDIGLERFLRDWKASGAPERLVSLPQSAIAGAPERLIPRAQAAAGGARGASPAEAVAAVAGR